MSTARARASGGARVVGAAGASGSATVTGASGAAGTSGASGSAKAAGTAAAVAELRLLGGFALVDGEGRSVALPTRKAQALLAVLGRRPGAPVTRGRLAGLLWPDRPDAQGRGSLRQALASVRKALAACGVEGPVTSGDEVTLPHGAPLPSGMKMRPTDPLPGPLPSRERARLTVDVAEVERALEAGDLEAALARYQGPFLHGFPPVEDLFDDWAETERAALAARAAEAFRSRLTALTVAGEVEAGLALAERALAVDPALEPAYLARMKLLALRGDRAGALREYERCTAALSRAVGAAPSAETRALRAEIDAPSVPPPRAGRRAPSLAVMPFEVLSDAPAAATFAVGLAEDIGVELSRFRSLEVIARDSCLRAAQDGLDPAALGRVLGAEYLLLASVRLAGGRVRVAARLVETDGARQAWAERFDGEVADLFGLQESLARAVVSALSLRVDASELARARGRPEAGLDAYACWIRGMTALRRGTLEADLEARALFQRAVELDPGYARAHAGLSLSHFNDWSCSAWERWDENEREAFRHAQEAVRLDDQDGVVHAILGRILLYRREFARAAEHLDRALARSPGDADVLANLSIGHSFLGDGERGVELAEAARRLHPFHPEWYLACLAFGHFLARRPGEAVALFERAPDAHVDTRAFLCSGHAHLGDLARARVDGGRFLARFCASIAPGARPADAVAWVLRVNPMRRDEDQRYLLDGLARGGVPVRE